MDKLTYKDFVWPRNPEKYRQQYLRKPTYGEDEEGNTVFQGLGALKHTITGSGAFTGTDAWASFQQLADLCGDPLAGDLTHPVWGTVSAFLTELQMDQEPRENYVAYSFTFQAADENGDIPQ